MTRTRGGRRSGAGRPEGSRNKRSLEVAALLEQPKNNPIQNLLRLGRKAEASDDLRLAVECFKTLMPYYAPKPRPEEDEQDVQPTQMIIQTNFPIPGSLREKTKSIDEEDYI